MTEKRLKVLAIFAVLYTFQSIGSGNVLQSKWLRHFHHHHHHHHSPESKNKEVKTHQTAKKPPNIVFVMVDDLGFHDVGYHGSKMKTPTLNKLAEDGVKLENYYVQPSCSPTRCTLLSGRYLIHTGLQHGLIGDEQPNALPRNSPTLADKLRETGYATHIVGKWHAGYYKEEYMPHHRGFDSFFGYLNGHEDHYTHKNPYKKKSYLKSYLDLRYNDTPIRNMSGHYSTLMYTKRAQEVVENHNKSKPLFLYLAHQAVHSPMEVPEEYEKPFQGVIKDKNRRIYAGMLYALDEGIANLTKTLKDNGLWDDTIMVVSTDNGGMVYHGGNNYPLRGWKFSLWEGGIRGVGFVTGGKNIKLARGSSSNGLMHISDWYPTLISIAGGHLNGTLPLDGVNNWKMLSQGAPSERNVLLHNVDPLYKKKGKRRYKHYFDTRVRTAIRIGDYKLITGNPGIGKWIPPPEVAGKDKEISLEEKKGKNVWLFNITADPAERKDLSRKHPEVVKNILTKLAKINATSVPVYFPPDDPKSNPALHGGVWGPWE